MPTIHPSRLRSPDRCDRCRRWLPRGSYVVRVGVYTRCASCAGMAAHRHVELFQGADLGFALRADVQRAGPTFAELQAEREARQELDDQQMELEIMEA
jgi:hypothetical protein